MLVEIARIIIPVDVNEASPNRPKKRAEANRIRGEHNNIARRAWVEAGRPMVDGKVRVNIVIRRARAIDPFNAMACLKHVIDGVFRDALTVDDSEKFIEIGTLEQITAPEYKGACSVEFIVESINHLSEAA